MSPHNADERVVDLRGRGLGESTRQILELAERSGYTVAAAGPGAYRLARSRRKLLGKHTESVMVSIYDDRGGSKARFVGPIDPGLLQHLTAGAEPSTVAPEPAPSVPPIGPAGPASAPPAMPAPVERPAPRAAVGPPGGLIASVPGMPSTPSAGAALPPPVATPSVHTETADLDEHTIASIQRETLPAPAVSASTPGLVLPGGRFVALTTPVVIGRDPDPARGAPGAVALPVSEPSLSKTHLTISYADGRFIVIDLHSSNGTVVEAAGARARLEPGVAASVRAGEALIAGALVIEVVGP